MKALPRPPLAPVMRMRGLGGGIWGVVGLGLRLGLVMDTMNG